MSTSSRPPARHAVLFFGLLNTFDRIYSGEAPMPNIVRGLEDLGESCDIYVDTSALAFVKVPAETVHEGPTFDGLPILERVPASSGKRLDYFVLEDSEASIRQRLAARFGDQLANLHLDPPDRRTWTGKFYVRHMILTFMRRKQRLVETALAAAERRREPYELLFLCRPDSALRRRGTAEGTFEEVAACLAEDISKLRGGELIGVDNGGFDEATTQGGLRLLKNDILIGGSRVMQAATGLAERIGSVEHYRTTYSEPAFRCGACMTLYREPGGHCPMCGSDQSTAVDSWPEYKTSEHINACAIPTYTLSLTGSVLRAG